MAPLIGLIIGFLMCIPVGPINVWVINTQIKKGKTQALSIAAGGSLMDLLYFYVILSGLSLFHFSDTTVFYGKLLGIILIFTLGVKEVVSKPQLPKIEGKKETPKDFIAGLVIGIIIYTSNPTLILTMTGLGAFVKSLGLFSFIQINIILVSLGLALGSFLWFVFLVKMVGKYKEKIQNEYLSLFSKISGILMIALSIILIYQLAQRVQL